MAEVSLVCVLNTTVLVLILATLFTLFVGENIATLKVFTYEEAILVLIVLVAVLPLFYISFIVLHWLCFRCEIGQRCVSRIHVWMKRIFPKRRVIQPLSDDLLPDRLLNIEEYASPEDENTEGEESHSSGEETAYWINSWSIVHALTMWWFHLYFFFDYVMNDIG